MKPRGMLSVALGACAAVVALALVFGHTTDRSRVCPTIGYAYVGDVELSFNHEPASVAACFGEGCTPATVAKNPDGRWLVPQSLPYLVAPVSVTSINVEAASSSGVRHTRVLPIETEPSREYPYGKECGGPFSFKPVQVPSSPHMNN